MSTDETRKLMEACARHASLMGVPGNLCEGIVNYVYTGQPMGGYLTAVFADLLREAVMRADPKSLAFLKDTLLFIYNELPGECHGSPTQVRDWINSGGDPEWVPDSMEWSE
jgi:hypothetical protein